MNEAKQGPMNISPFAILAAILFNVGKTREFMVKPDDASEAVSVHCPLVAIEESEDGSALVAMVPFQEIAHFMTIAYQAQMQVENNVLIMSFERKSAGAPQILSATGSPIKTKSEAVQKLTDKLKGIGP